MRERSEIVEIARGWLGTPYHHQAAVRGTGADCIGFVKGVALEGGLITPELAREIPTDYARQQSGRPLRRMLGDLLIAVPDLSALPADVFLMRIEGEDQHIGLYTDRGIIHHCHSDVKGVVEHRLDGETRKMIARSYRFRSLA